MNQDLLESYKATTYEVPTLNLKIRLGESNDDLNTFLKENNLNRWLFITAWNPHSKPLPGGENIKRNKRLETDLKSYTYYRGLGTPDKDNWTPEESFFVTGISQEGSIELANKYDQNGIIYGTIGQNPELILLGL